MQLSVTNPALQRFVVDQVRAGNFPDANAVVEDALARMMEEKVVLTDEDIAAIKEADEQFERGEYVEFQQFAQEMRKKHGLK
jgi:Arc/MetJ-type ribon-helix-helix transcriptional regulator